MSALNPKPETHLQRLRAVLRQDERPKPETRNPKPTCSASELSFDRISALNPKPETHLQRLGAVLRQDERPKPETRNPPAAPRSCLATG